MTYEPAKPRYTLVLAEKSYDVVGSFELIDAVEYALKDNIVSITMRCIEMPVSDLSRVLSAILTTCGNKLSAKEIGETIMNMGIGTTEHVMLALHVHAFLSITISRPSDREEVSKKMGELLGGMKSPPDSLGKTIANSA